MDINRKLINIINGIVITLAVIIVLLYGNVRTSASRKYDERYNPAYKRIESFETLKRIQFKEN